MKRTLCIVLIFLILQACGNKKADIQANDRNQQLVESSDCKTCHHATTKIIGPSYLEVAKKYETNDSNIKLIAEKIIKGGSGSWGDIPMTPHPDISQQDADAMARYILSLDEK